MIEEIRKIALKHAMELSRDRCASEASEIVKDASVFEAYLCGAGIVPINQFTCDRENFNNFFDARFCCSSLNGGQSFALRRGQASCDDKNQTFSGRCVPDFAHKENSSQKENTSGPELPTPGSTETVVPTGGAVTEPGTHARTDGGE